MSLKPSIARNVPADGASMTKVLGPRLGALFAPRHRVVAYAFVLRLPTDGTVTSRALAHALGKLPEPRGAILIAGHDFTVEARQVAAQASCELISVSEFGWTDAAHAARAR
jgi:hypothetical protein